MQPRNLRELFEQVVAAHPDKVAFRHKLHGSWVDVTWARHREEVDRASRGLIASGVTRGDRVCILGATSLAWVQADAAIVNCGGVTVGIYPSNLGPDCAYIIDHSDAELIFVENQAQLEKLQAVRSAIPRIRTIVLFAGPSDPARGVVSWEELQARGDAVSALRLEEAGRSIEPDDLATLVYTSGTTGVPKGVMITHRNLLFSTWTAAECLRTEPHFVTLAFLPLAHVFARLIAYVCMRRALTVAFAEDASAVAANMKEIRPHFITSVPRIFEKISEKINRDVAEAGQPRRALFAWALGVGRRVSRLRLEHSPLPPLLALQHAVADRLVLCKVRAAFGGRLVYAVSGGAPLNPAIGEFFHAFGITILQGIGMTENTSFTNVNRLDRIKFDTVGPVGPAIEMKVAGDGEILFRGQNVMQGYFKDPAATAETVDPEGWLHSGDIGRIDEDGHLEITDRKKDLIITAGGKNIAPQRLERILGASPYIGHAVVYGDRCKYLTALVTLEAPNIRNWARDNGLGGLDPAALATHEKVQELIQQEVTAANQSLASFETVKKFRILPGELSIEGGDLTPTLKLKRRVVVEKHRALIDEMYA